MKQVINELELRYPALSSPTNFILQMTLQLCSLSAFTKCNKHSEGSETMQSSPRESTRKKKSRLQSRIENENVLVVWEKHSKSMIIASRRGALANCIFPRLIGVRMQGAWKMDCFVVTIEILIVIGRMLWIAFPETN